MLRVLFFAEEVSTLGSTEPDTVKPAVPVIQYDSKKLPTTQIKSQNMAQWY
jgi:hypothetical protein